MPQSNSDRWEGDPQSELWISVAAGCIAVASVLIAKVAMARKLAVHLYWMWRQGCDYGQWQKVGSHAGKPGNRDGVQ